MVGQPVVDVSVAVVGTTVVGVLLHGGGVNDGAGLHES